MEKIVETSRKLCKPLQGPGWKIFQALSQSVMENWPNISNYW